MTSYFDVYQDARRKLSPKESLLYTISDARKNHPALCHYYSKDTMEIVNNLINSVHKLERCVIDLRDMEKEYTEDLPYPNLFDEILKMREEGFKHLSFYLGEEVVLEFVIERFENLD